MSPGLAEAIIALAMATPPERKCSLAFSERGPLLQARHEIVSRNCPAGEGWSKKVAERLPQLRCEFGACGAAGRDAVMSASGR
ncbi:hypothetical protein BOS5A_110165 [Bosea sp. EC-HK365B]|nr:hypothetical protein BOSE7B_10039 [Bosea sp. 7B]CAD5247545.1 hypothetical protein BOSE21B_10166 [Bosea sp. 21B]CAD5270036.1 hypothetical protein BOSE46_150158 [Bosea sp. 46]VVT50934.1 hypothetical protein BOS5A_110165 [Bosea sp. EC-HK365B]VXA94508.1 hypothetical protein BOSE127_10040 [Bosea sp. 127]VXC04508.1 hypothetical protein BOSE29B_170150 [Bosea sp. 29B]VXC49151.1 hypothetical protein BOSE125_230148 [Bosea sp. 125]